MVVFVGVNLKKRKLCLERFVILYCVRYFKIGDTDLCFMFACLQSSKIKNGVEIWKWQDKISAVN